MKLRSVFILALLLLPLAPTPANAYCACCDENGDVFQLPNSEAITEDADCNRDCVAENDAYIRGTRYDEEAQEQEIRQSSASSQDAFLSSGLCQCYCGREVDGAQPVEGSFGSAQECKTECEATGDTFVVCAASLSETPINNLRCFTEGECTEEGGSWSTDQPYDCEPNMHYCFPEPKPIQLSTHLGGTTQVYDIGTYINAAYTYLLGAAAIVAVVMIMIGGVQYMIGSSVGHADAARKRIQNAVIGLMLIMGAYLILNTVNPYLVQLKTIELPLIKPSIFLSGSAWCEDLRDLDYSVVELERGETSCGKQGNVYRSPSGGEMALECVFKGCPTTGEACLDRNGKYECTSCTETNELLKENITISESLCAKLQPQTQEEGNHDQCAYIADADLNNLLSSYLSIAPVNIIPLYGQWVSITKMSEYSYEAFNNGTAGACGLVDVDCSQVAICEDYDDLDVYSGSTDLAELDSIEGLLESICKANPCAQSADGEVRGTCVVAPTTLVTYTLGVGALDCVGDAEELRRREAEELEATIEQQRIHDQYGSPL